MVLETIIGSMKKVLSIFSITSPMGSLASSSGPRRKHKLWKLKSSLPPPNWLIIRV